MRYFILAGAVALSLASHAAKAEAALANGTPVRILANSIDDGWLTGRLHLDAQNCWMVKLDKATRDHYTMLSLLAVDQLQVANGSDWQSVGVRPLLRASPAVCREYGAD